MEKKNISGKNISRRDFLKAAGSAAVTAGMAAGADLILIETMSDTYEMKAALLAAKENSDQANENRIGERAKTGGAHRKAGTRRRPAPTCTIKIKFEASRNKFIGRKTHSEMPHPASRTPQCPAGRTAPSAP